MANRKSNKPKYTAAEKKAFRAGMAKQYNNEHPKFGFAAAEKHTTYNENGKRNKKSVAYFGIEKTPKQR